jgi:hypothetical protein
MSAVVLLTALRTSAAAEGPLPRLAVSLQTAAADAGAPSPWSPCASVGCLAVAPAVTLGGETGGAGSEVGRYAAALPAGSGLFLHVRLPGRARSTSPKSDESALDAEVDRLLGALPLVDDNLRGLILEVGSPGGDPGLLQLAVATLSVRAKAIRPALEVVVVFPPGGLVALGDGAKRMAAYADVFGVTLGDGWRREVEWAAARVQRPLAVMVPAQALGAEALVSVFLDLLIDQASHTPLQTVWVVGATRPVATSLSEAFAFLSRSIPAAFVPARESASPTSVEADDGREVSVGRFVTGESSDVILLAGSAAAGTSLRVRVTHREPGFEVTCYDPRNGRRLQAVNTTEGGSAALCTADGGHVLVVMHQAAAADKVATSVNVTGRPDLRVEEVIARWQQYREEQRRLLRHYTAKCLLSLHFEQAGFASGFDVSIRMREFSAGGAREWIQDEFYVNGVRFAGRRGFPLPQLEPEKVVTQPLELSLDERYRYVLDGIDTVDGALCYVVRFEPGRGDETLYSGRIWIEGTSFRHLRFELQQRGGRSNIVSHVERQDFQLVSSAGAQYTVFRTITVRQVLNAAGRSLLLEKSYHFSDYRFNDPGYDTEVAAARQSDRPMFRETPDGLRALKVEAGERKVVAVDTSRIKSLVAGAFYEGTYDFPIPMAGVSLVDFNYRSTGRQLSLFFAGPMLALNLSKQQTGRLRVSADLALSALPQNNRRYDGDVDVTSEGLWVFEETVGGLVSWQATPDWSLSGATHVGLNLFRATSDTAPEFEIPGTGSTLYLTGESKLTKGGYSVTTTVSSGLRFGWSAATGIDGSEPLASRYLKYYAEVGKQFYIRSFHKAGLTASYYGGDNLDRFSRYQPSFLTRPRIRGIPGGADTFDDVAVVGASYGFNVMDVVKLEGIYNHAWGRNRSESNGFRDYDGVEFDASTAAPWDTFLQATVALAARGNTRRYNSRWGFYLLVFKPL